MNKIEKFEFSGQEFEVRVAEINGKFCVKVFLGSNQVSPEYSVDFETHQDYFSQYQESLVGQLIDIAKSDIEKGMYYKA